MKVVAMVVEIRSLYQEGLNKSQIAARLGIHRETVSRYLAMPEIPTERTSKRVPGKINPYREHITQRLEKYPELSAQRLYREIRKQGYQGSARTVRRVLLRMRKKGYVRRYRPASTLPAPQSRAYSADIVQSRRAHTGRFAATWDTLPVRRKRCGSKTGGVAQGVAETGAGNS